MSLPDPIDPATRYRVVVSRPIKRGVATLLPRDTHEMTGKFLTKLIAEHGADVIRSAEPNN